MSDPRLSELRLVEWELAGREPGAVDVRRELVLASEVELLCAAVLRLHREGNPHTDRAPARLLRLSVGEPELGAGYWWSAPSLEEAGPRARIVRWRREERFVDPLEVDPPDPC